MTFCSPSKKIPCNFPISGIKIESFRFDSDVFNFLRMFVFKDILHQLI